MNEIIKLVNVSKIFKIPHVKTYDLKSYIIHFRKMRTFEKYFALNDITLNVKPGEFIGIIGPNGSGKSTLLKLIAGILCPTSGDVVVNGKISPFLELGVGFNPELSGRDNIFLYSSILGLSKKETLAKYDQILEFSELERFIDSPLKTFSSGMQVRLAFSVAIQSNAPILLVDEVLAVGDAAFQVKCHATFANFINEGRTILYVSHDMSSISRFCTKVVYLKRGKEAFVGDTKTMIQRYLHEL
jgi:ABC-type polysaccharide/polyol phosphate transport system ATPase subunit